MLPSVPPSARCRTAPRARPPGAATIGFALLVLLSASLPTRAVPSLEALEAPELEPIAGSSASGEILVDTFERYSAGRLPPQGGWTSTFDPIFTVAVDGIRGRSGRHVSDGFGEFVTDLLLSPVFGPSPGPVAVTVARSAGEPRHQIVPVDLARGLVLTRVELAPDGRILVGQLTPQGVFVFVPTGSFWAPDEPLRIGVATDDQGRLEVFRDGESIFVGVDVVQASIGSPGRIELLAFFANNTDEETRLLIDDVGPDPESLPPEPPALEIPVLGPEALGFLVALLGFAAVHLLWRRRPSG